MHLDLWWETLHVLNRIVGQRMVHCDDVDLSHSHIFSPPQCSKLSLLFFLSFFSFYNRNSELQKLSSMAASLAIGLRTAFLVVGCLSTATVIYTVVTDGSPFRKELLTPWMVATLVDFYINILAIGAWIVYKESKWILSVIWIVLLICFGSITTCAYIVVQFLKLTPQESLLDPIYYVLLRNRKREEEESKSIVSVTTARFVFSILGCVMLATLAYTIATDGSPFRQDILTPWLSATLVDFYANVIALSVWVAYKETTWIKASIWIILLICLGSASTCAYIALQLFHLAPHDPVYLVLFNSDSRAVNGYQGTLQTKLLR